MVAYAPLGRGFLTGKIKSRADLDKNDPRLRYERFSEEVRYQNVTDQFSGRLLVRYSNLEHPT